MDVHPPEHGIHSWTDFWIHLGTITIGLLIAIGLEQSVEKLHQVHERHVLQQELRNEGLRNRDALRLDFERMNEIRRSLLQRRGEVDRMIASDGKLRLPYRAIPETGTIVLPSEATWDSAKASGRVALLPDAQTDVYSFLYPQDDWLKAQASALFAEETDQTAFERRFEPGFVATGTDGAMVYTSMSVAELKEYSILLDKKITQWDTMAEFLHYADSVNSVVLDGAPTQAEVIRKVDALAHASADPVQ